MRPAVQIPDNFGFMYGSPWFRSSRAPHWRKIAHSLYFLPSPPLGPGASAGPGSAQLAGSARGACSSAALAGPALLRCRSRMPCSHRASPGQCGRPAQPSRGNFRQEEAGPHVRGSMSAAALQSTLVTSSAAAAAPDAIRRFAALSSFSNVACIAPRALRAGLVHRYLVRRVSLIALTAIKFPAKIPALARACSCGSRTGVRIEPASIRC